MNKGLKPSGRVHMEAEPLAAISIGVNQHHGSTRWGVFLLWFMRLVSVVWLLQGLMQWHTIIQPEPANFDALPPIVAGITVFFAVIDPVAAVGLWLGAPWGGVIWLLAAVAQGALVLIMPELVSFGQVVLIFDFALIVAYFLLAYLAAFERDI
jgi:hypothetical protein